MKRSEVYLRAAERIAAGDGSNTACLNICEVVGADLDRWRSVPEVQVLQNWFKPAGTTRLAWVWEAYDGDSSEHWSRNFRTQMLLFMHHIAADEERK